MGLIEEIRGKNIYLDTNVFIYALEGYSEYALVLSTLFAAVDQGVIQAFTSELSLAESLVKPMMDNNHALIAL